ncbi:hypothetical protein HPB52_016999 [Rhipicephalus sanguineus]|uniref:Tick transposon n=1 Tax=Rhipicephalus sanguineus TaxID=34632 RepID=A0A9D4PFX0_RHISA|nr:hypothetical protein HPB52_016999 [Rhipicephalus sanguineus]
MLLSDGHTADVYLARHTPGKTNTMTHATWNGKAKAIICQTCCVVVLAAPLYRSTMARIGMERSLDNRLSYHDHYVFCNTLPPSSIARTSATLTQIVDWDRFRPISFLLRLFLSITDLSAKTETPLADIHTAASTLPAEPHSITARPIMPSTAGGRPRSKIAVCASLLAALRDRYLCTDPPNPDIDADISLGDVRAALFTLRTTLSPGALVLFPPPGPMHLPTEDVMLQLSGDVRHPSLHKRTGAILAWDLTKKFDNVQHTAILDALSSLHVATHAVLSPLLFTITLFPLERAPRTIPPLSDTFYVDDIPLWVTSGNLGDMVTTLQAGVEAVTAHARVIGLSCSPTKSGLLLLLARGVATLSPSRLTVSIDGLPLPLVSTLRTLGLFLQFTGKHTTLINQLSNTCPMELTEGQHTAQLLQLSRTRPGRALVSTLKLSPVRHLLTSLPILSYVVSLLIVHTLPKNMHPEHHPSRRAARASTLWRKLGRQLAVAYVNATPYHHYAAHALAVNANSLRHTIAASVYTSTSLEAEKSAVALSMTQTCAEYIFRDSKPGAGSPTSTGDFGGGRCG